MDLCVFVFTPIPSASLKGWSKKETKQKSDCKYFHATRLKSNHLKVK